LSAGMTHNGCCGDVVRMVAKKESADRLRILMIGPLPPPTGGARVLFKNLVACLDGRDDVHVTVVETPPVRSQKLKAVVDITRQMYKVLKEARRTDVLTLHTTTTALCDRILFVALAAWIHGRPFVVHTFGGIGYREMLGPLRSRLAEAALRRAHLYLAETHRQVGDAHARGLANVAWFPNSRPLPDAPTTDAADEDTREGCRRFVYVGHVREYKGMRVLAMASRQLPGDVTVDVYGPWFDDLDRHVFDECPNIRYHGPVKPEEVVATMRRHDALVLPTVASTEGYPGVVLESYTAGLPVIASRIGGIPEIVDESVGILVKPNDDNDLGRAMTKLSQDQELFSRLRANTAKKAEFFSSSRWAEKFLDWCREAAVGPTCVSPRSEPVVSESE